MKFGVLRCIGHNVADSLADGNGFLIGMYSMDVFAEAKQSRDGFIKVDFLTGTSSGGLPSYSLARAFELYAKALPSFCEDKPTGVIELLAICSHLFQLHEKPWIFYIFSGVRPFLQQNLSNDRPTLP